MKFDYDDLSVLRHQNETWKLLSAEHAPLILAFLQKAFVERGVTMAAESELCLILENIIFNATDGAEAFPKPANQYLIEWAADNKRWLRRTYQSNSDEPFYDITPASQKALEFINSLHRYSFVGTESRFMLVIQLLHQITLGTVAEPHEVIADLKDQIAALSNKLEQAQQGQIQRLTELEVLDRFQQFEQIARSLLSDFRAVEYNLRDLDKGIRQRIAQWEGSKGELLGSILENSDGIENSQQGQSVAAFSALLLNPNLQDEVRSMIDEIYRLSSIKKQKYDENVKNVYRGWIAGNEHIQKTMGALSKQLKHFIDDKIYLENRRILELLRKIEKAVIDYSLLDNKEFLEYFGAFSLELPYAEILLPFERPLYTVKEKPKLNSLIEEGPNNANADPLFEISAVDRSELIYRIRMLLSEQEETNLYEVIQKYPLKHGLTELIVYFSVIEDNFASREDPNLTDLITWQAEDKPMLQRQTKIKRLYIKERN